MTQCRNLTYDVRVSDRSQIICSAQRKRKAARADQVGLILMDRHPYHKILRVDDEASAKTSVGQELSAKVSIGGAEEACSLGPTPSQATIHSAATIQTIHRIGGIGRLIQDRSLQYS